MLQTPTRQPRTSLFICSDKHNDVAIYIFPRSRNGFHERFRILHIQALSSNRILPDAFATTSPRVCFVDLLLIGKNRFQFVDFVVAAADLRDRRSDLSALRRDVSTDHNGRQKERVTIVNTTFYAHRSNAETDRFISTVRQRVVGRP